jgi:hypothetical protein
MGRVRHSIGTLHLWSLVFLAALGMPGFMGCGDEDEPADSDVPPIIQDKDNRQAPEDIREPEDEKPAEEQRGGEVETVPEETVQRPRGCGDGLCKGSETPESCAKDCMEIPEKAAFVFAHKGDELGCLGRIYDLIESGSGIFVFYLTFDETPLAQYYDGSASKLSVGWLGVPPQNIFVYEEAIEWNIISGNHEILDRLVQHLQNVKPDSVYLPQLCGGELEDELAHVVGLWAAKRAKIFPQYFEFPARSNYYIMEEPDGTKAKADPDGFVDKFLKRWRLLPKDTEALKPVLQAEEMAKIRSAAAHIQNPWFQAFFYTLPEDRILYLLRELQQYRAMPTAQKAEKKPFVDSLDNPQGKYIYQEQGYTFDEFKQMAWVIESFYGTNLRSDPSALPFYDEPFPVKIMHDFDVNMTIRSFSPEADTLTFTIGFGPSKEATEDCEKPTELAIDAMGKATVSVHCNAKEPVGPHTYYFRIYSQLAKTNNDAALFTELPFKVKIY